MRNKALLLAVIGLIASHASFASGDTPAISLGVMHCGQTYLVQLFDNGLVEYRGLRGVKAVGRRKTVVKSSIINGLLEQAENSGFFLTDNRINLPRYEGFPRTAIRIEQGEKTVTLLNANSALSMKDEILKIQDISKWVGKESQKGCFFYDAILNNDLKIKN